MLALVGQARELPFQSAAKRRQRSIAGVNPSYFLVITQYSPAFALAIPVRIYVLVQATNVYVAMQISSQATALVNAPVVQTVLHMHTPSVCSINDILEMALYQFHSALSDRCAPRFSTTSLQVSLSQCISACSQLCKQSTSSHACTFNTATNVLLEMLLYQ